MIFVFTAAGILALGLGLYLLASHYDVTTQLWSLLKNITAFIESFDHPFVIGLLLIVLGGVLLFISFLMRRQAYRTPPP